MTIHEFGTDNDKVIVLIHPAVVMWDYYEYVIPLLEKCYHVIVPALPGYDFSSNRLDYANHVLSWTTNNDWRAMRDHFVAITNQLLSSGQPLSVITVGVP